MVSKIWYKIFVVSFVLLLYQPLSLSIRINDENKLFKQEFEQVATALERVIEFLVRHVEAVNLDAAYGVLLAQGNLKMVLEKFMTKNIDPSAIKSVQDMIEKSQYIIDQTLSGRHKMSSDYKIFAQVLLNPNMWTFLTKYQTKPFVYQSQQWTLNNAFNKTFYGHPDESESDKCILELINSTSQFNDNEPWPVSKFCKNIMLDQPLNLTSGYVLTHRLLYFQVGRALFGAKWNRLLDSLSWMFCNKIYSESLEIASLNFPFYSRDLFLEQLVLCGMEGYKQMWNSDWTSIIIKWQNEEGCYKAYTRRKRASNHIGSNKCSSHFTGLASAVLAMRLNWILQDYNIWPYVTFN